jgi:hypothetical protein
MLELARALAQVGRDLVPRGRFRWQLLALVMIATAVPLTELVVTKIFTDVITRQSTAELSELIPEFVLFCVLFVATRVAHYWQKVYRVTYFDRVFTASQRKRSANIESWEWALGLELVNILTFLSQMIVLAIFFTILAPVFGALNLVLIVILIEVVGRLYRRQVAEQRDFVERRRAKEKVDSHTRVRTRIVSAEAGGLISAMGVLLLLVALLLMSLNGLVSVSNTLVLFLGLRMQNSTFASLSGGVMRFARARANSY